MKSWRMSLEEQEYRKPLVNDDGKNDLNTFQFSILLIVLMTGLTVALVSLIGEMIYCYCSESDEEEA